MPGGIALRMARHLVGLGAVGGVPPLDGVDDPVLVMGADGRVLAASAAAARLVQAIGAGAIPDTCAAIRASARDERGRALRATFRDNDASAECDLTVIPLGDGRALVLARFAALDRSLREALVDSRRRYKDLVEISSDFAWETGADGAFVFVSPAGALGWSAEQLVGHRPEEFCADDGASDDDGLPVPSPFHARRATQDAEVRFCRADGSTAILSASVRPLYDEEGRWSGARGLCRDVTEACERDAQLARAHVRERLFGYIVRTMRDEVEPANMLAAAAAALARALTAQGTEIYRVAAAGPARAAAFGEAAPFAPAHSIAAALRRPGAVAASGDGALMLAVATRYQGTVNGALHIWRRADLGPFADDERAIVTEAAGHLGIAIEQIAAHEQLRELSATDPMTGLLNRRSFMAELARRFERSAKGGAPGALVYCDLDNFKQVNDTHGHERGDAAICEMARILRGSTRGEDLVARLGGDEFALWLEGVDPAAAAAKADLLLERGAALRPYSGGDDCPLGMSLGIAAVVPGSGEALDQLMARADVAMYASKKHGKGRATVAPPPEPARRRAGEGA